ncbi:MAG: hypothetical protein ABW040_07870 [Microbacteriaceae bacterium]
MNRPLWIPASVAGLALVLAITNSALTVGFTGASPVELIYSFGISLDLVAVAVILGATTVLRYRRRSLTTVPEATPVILRDGVPEPSPLSRLGQIPATIGALLSAVAITAWTLLSGIPMFAALAFDEPLRYMNAVAAAFFFGIPWVLGLVFSTIALRADAPPRQRLFAGIGLALGLLLAVPIITAAALYSAGAMA